MPRARAEGGEEFVGLGEFLALAPIGGVAGEAHQVDGAVFENRVEVRLPGRAEHPPSAPGLGFAAGAGVEVREVEEAQTEA